MKINFKQRTIDNKIKVYSSIIGQWVQMRNFIFSKLRNNFNPYEDPAFDSLYGQSQAFIGDALLVSEDAELAEKINYLTEKFYRTDWPSFPIEKSNEIMEDIKKEAWNIIGRMREDVENSTRLEKSDLLQVVSGFCRSRKIKKCDNLKD
jgi:hypothetical protein